MGKPQALSTGGVSPAAAAVGRPRHRPQGGCPPWVGSGVVHGQSGFRAQRSRLFLPPSGSAGNDMLRIGEGKAANPRQCSSVLADLQFQSSNTATMIEQKRHSFCLIEPTWCHNDRAISLLNLLDMATKKKYSTDLRKLTPSPTENPLLEPQQVRTKRRLVKSGRSEDLVNSATGEITGVAAIHQIEERDDAGFVKVFGAGVAAAYELGKTAQRVFQVVLDQYQRTPMSRVMPMPSSCFGSETASRAETWG